LFHKQFDSLAETTLLNQGFRNTDSSGIADAHQFDSHNVSTSQLGW